MTTRHPDSAGAGGPTRTGLVGAAWAGVAAAVLGAGLGELTAALLAPPSSPFAAIGGFMIDIAPPWAKDAAIELFGTFDKIALLIGIGIVLALVAAAAGVLELLRPPWGRVALLLLAAFGLAAALSRANATGLSWVPSAVAGIVSMFTLGMLVRRLPAPTASVPDDDPEDATTAPDRRRFLLWSGGAAALGVLAALGSAAAGAGRRTATMVRDAIRLPEPAVPAPPVPDAADLEIPGLAPVITPNRDFYRIDTALVVPQVDPGEWTLRIHGMVENEVTIDWQELLDLPLEESAVTLACVSNEVGGGLIGNAMWLGYPIRELLARAVPSADADMVLSRSVDGFTAGTPLEVLTDERNAILAVGMNGEPLPAEHGFPVRMVVPGLYGYVSATKWVVDLEVTRFDAATAYWTDRGWSERGPVKLQSRIDVPQGSVDAGERVIAGVAWQQHVGIRGVEVQVDDGPWQQADLARAMSDDTWVQWSLAWTAKPGEHRIRCRATNAQGETQTSERVGVVPDGATGWHEVTVAVG
ncbi:molybdopterin-dependent oxidoreductase [Microbacterium sp. LRZ72]|uniref:molybdopterin-dependent oxidoreductase n=1 Tax=Microbacterium sp. LRZ72 TaxID=2942481 RepID=UPI0029B861AC|nr:molybdopterin-dependent oxidoreductase [Microbacterium sp. LRZ72]MDX2376461.1 molybdopterin-dependent oxidoreductase [Microbacterium sp. LRZ72]